MANDDTPKTLEERVQGAILEQAVYRWESAVVIAMTLLLTVFAMIGRLPLHIPWFAWLLGGVIAEAVLVFSSYSDPKFGERVVQNLLRNDFQPAALKSKELQKQVEEALEYRSRIASAVSQQSDSLIKDNLRQTASEIDDWLENIYNLAQRLDRYLTQREVLERDKKHAGIRVSELRQRLGQELDSAVKKQMEVTMGSLQRQVDTIDALENTIRRARLQLEHTMSALGTIYSQTILMDAKDIDSGHARRIQQDIADEVSELGDILLAMEDVYASNQQ